MNEAQQTEKEVLPAELLCWEEPTSECNVAQGDEIFSALSKGQGQAFISHYLFSHNLFIQVPSSMYHYFN